MASLIKQWSHLEPGYYFDPALNLTENRSGKTSLRTAFRQSASQIQEVEERFPEKDLIKAAENAFTRWEHALNKANRVQRLILKMYLSKEYHQFVEQLATNFSKRDIRFKDFVEEMFANQSWLRNKFVSEKVTLAAVNKILRKSALHPSIYEISKDGVVKGHMMGTCRAFSSAACKDSEIWRLADRCKEFISEFDHDTAPLEQRALSWMSEDYTQTAAPIDFALMHRASSKGAKITALEKPHSLLQTLLLTSKTSVQPRKTHESAEVTRRLRHGDFAWSIELIEAIQEHDEADIEFLTEHVCPRDQAGVKIHQKTANWLHQPGGLVEKLTTADPENAVCMACDATHLYGPQGLIEGLRALGFTVTKLTEKERAAPMQSQSESPSCSSLLLSGTGEAPSVDETMETASLLENEAKKTV